MVVTAATPGVMGLASSTGINIDLIVRVLRSGGAITELKKIGNDTQIVQNKINKTTDKLGEQISITQNKMPRFQMYWLSIMFFAMQMQRTMMGFLSSAADTMTKIEGYTGNWQKATMRLGAAWEYLKFRFLDVLASSPLFMMIIDWFVQLVDGISGLDDNTLSLLAGVFIAITGAMGAIFFIAQLGLLINGLKVAGLIPNLQALTTFFKDISAGKLFMAGIGIILTIKSIEVWWEGVKDKDLLKIIMGALGAGAGVGLTFYALGAGSAAAIAISIPIILALAIVGIAMAWDTEITTAINKVSEDLNNEAKKAGIDTGFGQNTAFVDLWTNINLSKDEEIPKLGGAFTDTALTATTQIQKIIQKIWDIPTEKTVTIKIVTEGIDRQGGLGI